MKNNSQYKKADFRRHAADFRDDSHRYVSIALREMSIYDKASIEFPTGTGKTRIIHCDLLRFLPDSGNDVFCIASHRLMLNVQHIKGLLCILKHAIPDVAFIFVGSQPIDFSQITKGNKSLANEIIALLATYNEPLQDSEKILPNELIQQTCSSIELKSIVETHKEKGRDVIIISTYHSLEKLAGIPLHTIYCDEAHMIAGPRQTEFMKAFETLTAERQYFFTGTPKEALKQNANKLICGEDEEHAMRFDRLMDNKEIFGERIKLTIKEAINATLIVQPIWHILYPDNIESVDRSDDIKSRGRMLQQCFKSHEKWLMGETADATKIAPKILVNCKGVEDIWKLEKEIRETFNTYKGKPIRIFGIASAGSGEDDDAAMMIDGKGITSRIDFLTELNELKDEEYAIIFHFNVLTEGIDVPNMTGVVFMTTALPTIIKTLQTIGRATRLHPGDRKRLFGSTDMDGTERMTLADRDTKWIKPYCAVMIPVLGDETNLMSATMKAMIPELADSVDFENRLLLSVGEDTAIGKTIFENPNELRTGLECSVAKPLFDIKEIYEEIQKTREIEFNNSENGKLTEIFENGENINETVDRLVDYMGEDESHKARVFNQLYKSKLELGKGTVFTPSVLREKMIKIANPGIYDKILVMYNVEFMTEFQSFKNVVFASDNIFKNTLVNKMFGNETILLPKNINNIKETFKDMKFDLIISNPPYNQNLDLKILKNIYDLGDKICFVHPAGWLYDNKMKNKLYNECRKLVNDSFVYYENIKDANDIFNIGLFTDVFITLIDKHKPGLCNLIYDIDIHGQSEIYKSLKNKVLKYCKKQNNLLNETSHSTNKINEIGISSIRGNPGLNDFYTFIQLKNENMHIGKDTKYPIKFFFDTIDECIIFKDYLKTKMARFCLSIFKMNQNLVNRKNNFKNGAIASVPYMPDYTRPWSDEDIAKELGLTDEELAWAINWIPDYYPEDAEKYAKYKTTE